MKGLTVLVLHKSATPKSRLSPLLTSKERKAFSLILLKGTLDAVARADLHQECFVVTSDRRALRLAAHFGASGLEEARDLGVNSAVERGFHAARSDYVLVLPSDLPFLRASDLKRAFTLTDEGFALVISPSRAFDGTNLLILSRSKPIELAYDSDSFWTHLARSARVRLRVAVYTSRGVLYDVDSVSDFEALARSRSGSESVLFARGVVG